MDDLHHRLTTEIKTLTFKNRQFKKNHAVVKAQLDEKVEEVKALKQQDEQRAESFLCINRLWEQLNDELQHLAARLDVQLDEQEPSDAEVAEVTAAAQAISDPYLRRLLVGDPSSIKAVKKAYGALQGGLSDAEKALIERSKATAEAFARVLDAVQQQSRYSSSLAAQIAGSEADAALKEENQRLSAEVARLQQQLDGSHAKALSTSQLLKDRESQLKIAEELRLAANNELAGKESQYNLLRGKLEELQHKVKEAEAEAAAAKAAAATAAPRPGSPAAVDAGLSSGAAGPGAAAAESADAAAALAPDIQEQLADLQRLCDKRAADLEAERVEHVKTKHLLEAAKSQGKDESWVPSTVTYINLRTDVARLNQEVAERRKEVDKALAERDAMIISMSNHNSQEATVKQLRAQLETQQKLVHVMNERQTELMQQAATAKQALAARLAAEEQQSTVDGLTLMINALQRELAQTKQQLQNNKVAGETVESSVLQLAAAKGQAEAARAQVALLQQRLRDKTATMLGGAAREAALQERLADLQALVDVLTTYTSDSRDVIEVRKSERELALRIKALEKAQQTHELQQKLAAATAVEGELRAALDKAAAAADALRGDVAGLKEQIVSLEAGLAKARKDVDFYEQDISSTNAAYEEMQQQNTALLAHLTQRDTAITDLQTAKQVVQQQLEAVQQQLKESQAQLAGLQGEHRELQVVREALEKDLVKAQADLTLAKEAVRAREGRVHEVTKELEAQNLTCKTLNELYDKAQDAAGLAGKRVAEAAELAEREKMKRQKLSEDNQLLKQQVERLRKVEDKDERVKELEESYEALRRMMKCDCCKTNPINAMLKNCNHVFCKACLEARCTNRDRKCPGCGRKFGGKDDIVDVYLGWS